MSKRTSRRRISAKVSEMMDKLFPGGSQYEYLLQRAKLVLAAISKGQTQVLTVVEMHDSPHPPRDVEEFPYVEVVIRIPGQHLTNPVTGKSALSRERLKAFFESVELQRAFVRWLAREIGNSIPPRHPQARLKAKFANISVGRPGRLPPKHDLLLYYEELIEQVMSVKAWLRMQTQRSGTYDDRKRRCLQESPVKDFGWNEFLAKDELSLQDLKQQSPEDTAISILAMTYRTSEHNIESRLFRPL
jgi:hypothetical protein